MAVLATVVLFGLGALLSNTVGAAQVAANARALHTTNATLGAAGIARAGVAQAVFFAYQSVGDADSLRSAVNEARRNLDAITDAGLASEGTAGTNLSAFVETGYQVVDLAEQRRWDEADRLRTEQLEPAFTELSEALQTRQTDLAALIADSERAAGVISRVVFVAIAFLIPALTILVFWFVMRGRIRKSRQREASMAARVKDERRLNKAKDDLIAGLSHELRTPLTTILGFSEILLERPNLHQEDRELLGLINASSADLSRMVNDLLTAARLDARALTTQSEQVDLADEVAAVVRPYRHQGQVIDVRVPPMSVRGDSLHVRQIIHNLISNALRYGGDNIVISAKERVGSAFLVVADDGPGVSPDMESAVFRRFVHRGRSSLVAGSVGLGLAISKELADKMGGTVQYERIGRWTTFVLRLPLYEERPARTPRLLAPVEAG
jgi:signal transduction histidine kinase